MSELVPVCLLDSDHVVIAPVGKESQSDCWACSLIRALYYIATGVTTNPSWDAQMLLDDECEWREQPR